MTTYVDNLLSHPDSLQKLQRELDDSDLSLPYPKWNQVRDLPYLDACVQEGVRMHPPFALPLERVVPAGGVTVLGRHLPEGTLVGGNPYVVNRHEATFGANAEEWSPERWLCSDEAHKTKLEHSMLTVSPALRCTWLWCLGYLNPGPSCYATTDTCWAKFGAGRRVCLGKHIGILEVKKLIPFLIRNYDVSSSSHKYRVKQKMAADGRLQIHIIDPQAFTVENGWFLKQRGFYCTINVRN